MLSQSEVIYTPPPCRLRGCGGGHSAHVALLFAIYIPELFPTEVRLRASGICNTFGRGATILTPFIVVALFGSHGVGGVLSLMIGLLVLQLFVVLLFGNEPEKRRLEQIESEAPLSPHPAKV